MNWLISGQGEVLEMYKDDDDVKLLEQYRFENKELKEIKERLRNFQYQLIILFKDHHGKWMNWRTTQQLKM